MTHGARMHWVLGGALVLLGTVVLVLLVRGSDKIGGKGAGQGRLWPQPSSFTISGDATEPIVPGSSVAIDLAFTNRRPLPLAVSSVEVRVLGVRAPNADVERPCAVSDYTVEQVPQATKITIPARGTRSLSGLGLSRQNWPRVGLVDRAVNQDGCMGATVELAYGASGSIGW